jgi:membrane-associated phospholipid phosphatase
VYSGLYYPVIISLVLMMKSFAQFNYTAFSFLILLSMHLACFMTFPISIPRKWRQYAADRSVSTRFLAFVHSYDGLPNSLPSMHVSVATLTALHLVDNLKPAVGDYALLSFAFPILIGASCVFTKQHYLVDLPPGALFGYAAYQFFRFLEVA